MAATKQRYLLNIQKEWGTHALQAETTMQEVLAPVAEEGRTEVVLLLDIMAAVTRITVIRTGQSTFHTSDAESHLNVRYGANCGVRVPSHVTILQTQQYSIHNALRKRKWPRHKGRWQAIGATTIL